MITEPCPAGLECMSECTELNAMIQHMTDDELEERRCGLKKEKFCCEKEVQGGKLSHVFSHLMNYHSTSGGFEFSSFKDEKCPTGFQCRETCSEPFSSESRADVPAMFIRYEFLFPPQSCNGARLLVRSLVKRPGKARPNRLSNSTLEFHQTTYQKPCVISN